MKLNFEIEYRTVWGESIGVNLGSNDSEPVMLQTEDGIVWRGSTEAKLPTGGVALLYRYGVWRDGKCVRREQASMPHVLATKGNVRTYNLKDSWHDAKRVAGVAVPVFSLRSNGSFGVGDFGDLKTMIDWTAMTGMKALQILPINDTTITNTWTDSYPYNSISIYAYHPQYVDLRQLPKLADQDKAAAYEAKRQALNALTQIDYEAVNNTKRAYLHDLFEQEGAATLASTDYKTFFKNNDEWLIPYAVFSVLRDMYGTPDFSRWPEHSRFDKVAIAAFAAKKDNHHKVQFYCYVQFLLHTQLLAASNYAREKDVILKGDIPIGISRASVEAWVEPFYFNMNGQAGAPPDPFSDKGQNWGFPT
ncbi:MAG: 4-alpha-glucanotransferase, partial [Bacteroidales bacterium]|nr:4-alpha-glucanotransferase [Candidatus Liminaster caballi]